MHKYIFIYQTTWLSLSEKVIKRLVLPLSSPSPYYMTILFPPGNNKNMCMKYKKKPKFIRGILVVTPSTIRILYKTPLLTEPYALLQSINRWCTAPSYSYFFFKYLTNVEYVINSWPVTSESTIMITNNFSALEVKTVECWIKLRVYLIRVQQPTAVRGPR